MRSTRVRWRESFTIVITLGPCAHMAVLRGRDGGIGVGLVEVYALDATATSRLGNLSTRTRGLGLSLFSQGMSNVLADAALKLRDSNGNLLMSDDNWQDDPDQAGLITDSHLAPEKAKEAALEVSLTPGQFTAILSGNGGTGVGIVDIYNKRQQPQPWDSPPEVGLFPCRLGGRPHPTV